MIGCDENEGVIAEKNNNLKKLKTQNSKLKT